jgi:hypothetical protein
MRQPQRKSNTSALQVFNPFDQGSEQVEEVLRRLRQTDSDGFTFLELARVASVWPMLSILVNRERCVLHRTDSKDGPLYTLQARSALDGPDLTPFKFAGDIVEFTREFVHPLATGEEFIRAFANREAWPEGPTWVVL